MSQYDSSFGYFYGYGSAQIPKSDAQLWCRNALRIFFGIPPETGVPRFYTSVMFGSLFALTHSLSTIVIFPALILLFVLIYSFVLGHWSGRLLIIGFISGLIALHEKIFSNLQLGAIMLDFLAFALSLAAVLLLWHGSKRDTVPNWTTINMALLCLGSVAAIRGLPILAGLMWVACLWVWFRAELTIQKLLLLLSCFLLPTFSQAMFHHHYDITSNLANALWSFTVPPYRWTVEGHEALIKHWLVDNNITTASIYTQYLQFVFSSHGLTTFFIMLTERIDHDLLAATQPRFILLCILLYLSSQIIALFQGKIATRSWLWPSIWGGITLSLLLLTPITQPDGLQGIALAWLSIILIASLYCRMKLIGLSLGLYLGSLIVFILLGSAGDERTASTYHFALYLGIITLMLQPILLENQPTSEYPTALPIVTGCHAILLLFLYFGVYLLPNSLQTQFQQALHRQPNHPKQNIAIKISQDTILDRALYFNGTGQTFLTQIDNVDLGKIITFKQWVTHPAPDYMVNPDHSDNDRFYGASLLQPYTLIEGKILEN